MNTLLVVDDDAHVYLELLSERNLPELEIGHATDLKGAERLIDTATIILGRPSLTAPLLHKATELRWLQSTFAGIEQFCATGIRKDYLLTGVKDLFGSLMSEYIFAYILAKERSLFETRENQRVKRWLPLPYQSLGELTIGIVGLGSIGSAVAKTAQHFNMHVLGLKRTRTSCPYVDTLYLPAEKSAFLSLVDYLVVTLPATDKTHHFINLEDLMLMKPSSIIMSVGRGSTINEEDLVTALEHHYIGGAVLDVFQEEPLPENSPLWGMEQVIVTPHNSAFSFPEQITELFCENYIRFITGKNLSHVVDFNNGY